MYNHPLSCAHLRIKGRFFFTADVHAYVMNLVLTQMFCKAPHSTVFSLMYIALLGFMHILFFYIACKYGIVSINVRSFGLFFYKRKHVFLSIFEYYIIFKITKYIGKCANGFLLLMDKHYITLVKYYNSRRDNISIADTIKYNKQ